MFVAVMSVSVDIICSCQCKVMFLSISFFLYSVLPVQFVFFLFILCCYDRKTFLTQSYRITLILPFSQLCKKTENISIVVFVMKSDRFKNYECYSFQGSISDHMKHL